jgi:NADPH2 dehydrogenase
MASGTSDTDGFVTQESLNHYKELTRANTGLVMVEYTFVHSSGKSEPNQMGIQSDHHILGLRKIAGVIKESGAIPAIQLTHSGAKSTRDQTGGPLISPSGIAVPTKSGAPERPDCATDQDIITIKNSFVSAAKRAFKAEFKIVELHSAHGYGLNQWLSPITNQRNDLYGGNTQNRARLLLEIIREIKVALPGILLSVRIPGMDHFPGGLNSAEMITIVKMLETSGVDIINVSSGIGGWRRPRERTGEGYLVEDAEKIQKQTQLPVIGVGGIKTAEFINQSLVQNRFSLAAVGRSILNNPEWGDSIGLI